MGTHATSFAGFSTGTLDFLRALSEHNDKVWFEAHRDEYERHFMAPARAFVTAIGPALRAISPAVQAVPKVNGSIMRIHRDTRFARDKTPYKTHLDLMFWEGEGRARQCPAFVFRLTGEQLIVGAGKHGFEPDGLRAFRAAVADEHTGAALAQAVRDVKGAGYDVHGETAKRVPRGYAKDHERADLLRHKSLYVVKELGLPDALQSAECVELCVGHYRAMAPLHAWMVALHQAAKAGT